MSRGQANFESKLCTPTTGAVEQPSPPWWLQQQHLLLCTTQKHLSRVTCHRSTAAAPLVLQSFAGIQCCMSCRCLGMFLLKCNHRYMGAWPSPFYIHCVHTDSIQYVATGRLCGPYIACTRPLMASCLSCICLP